MAGPQRKPRLMSLSASASLFVSSTASVKRNKRVREPVAVDALPLSSSSSSDEQAGGDGGQRKGQAPKTGHASDSSASGGYSRRGDMGRTAFRPSAAPMRNARQSSQTGPSHRAMDLRQRSVVKRGTSAQDDDDSSASPRGSKRPRPAAAATAAVQPQSSQASSQGSQASGADGLFSRNRRHPPRVGYSRQPSFEPAGRDAAGSLKAPGDGGSEPQSRSTFIRPRKLSSEAESPPKRFRHKMPAASEDENEASLPKARFKWPTKRPARSPSPTKKATEERYADVPLGSTLESLKGRQKWRQRQRPAQTRERPRPSQPEAAKKALQKAPAEDEEKAARPAVFRMPAACSTDSTEDQASFAGGELVSSDEQAGDSGDDSEGTMAFEAAACPLCSAPMDEETLQALLPAETGPDRATPPAGSLRLQLMKFDDKMSFCAAHRQRTARETWTRRGYPDIDWAGLHGRIQKHGGHVQGVLEDTVPSHFRGLLQEQRGSSGSGGSGGTRSDTRERDASRGGTSSVPGYYGQRGLRIMSEAIVQRFSVVLRRQAVQDPLIAARGYLQFVQDVLVPELAVRLIMEDMGVGAEGARQILGESVAMGELMHEDVDVVTDGEEDGEEGSESGRDGG